MLHCFFDYRVTCIIRVCRLLLVISFVVVVVVVCLFVFAFYFIYSFLKCVYLFYGKCLSFTPQWGAADADIKVPSGENTELKRSPFKAWSRSVYSHTCYAYCQRFLPCLFLPSRSIHLHFFPKHLLISPVLAVANTWFLCRPAE